VVLLLLLFLRLEVRKMPARINEYCEYCGMEKSECLKVRRQIYERCCGKCTHYNDDESKFWRALHKLEEQGLIVGSAKAGG
jgi:hypothetical protein